MPRRPDRAAGGTGSRPPGRTAEINTTTGKCHRVVSTDLGLAGIPGTEGCDASGGGDDGLLQNTGRAAGCQASYPKFLSFEQDHSDPNQVARDFACVATLGTGGCGFEQQLEAGLKALWPKTFTDKDGNAADTYTVPTTTGVDYLVGGTAKPAGTYPGTGTVTVTAKAKTDYILAAGATATWTATLTTRASSSMAWNS